MSDGSHRKMTRESAKDLIGLFLVLAIIIATMLAFQKSFRDPEGDTQKNWYYENIAPPAKGQGAPQRSTR